MDLPASACPVYFYDRPNVRPFWAITKHAEIIEISRQPKIFLSQPQLMIATREVEHSPQRKRVVRHLMNMDPPEHARYRDLVNRCFTPRAVRALEAGVSEIAQQAVWEIARWHRSSDRALECDFVPDFAARIPCEMMGSLLGVPEPDRLQLSRWTNETAGSADPEFHQGATAQETIRRSREAIFAYLLNWSMTSPSVRLRARRRRSPAQFVCRGGGQ